MNNRWYAYSSVLCALSLVFLFAGCGKTIIVKGQLKEKGQPVTYSGKDMLQMRFHPEGEPETGVAHLAAVNPDDGTFVVKDRDGGGIVPGKYKVTVKLQSPYPSGPDRWKDKYSFKNSPLIVDVTNAPVEIEVSK